MVGGAGAETKVTPVTDETVPKVCFLDGSLRLVEVAERAGAGTARIAAGSTGPRGCRCARAALGRHRKDAELWGQLLAVALRALGFVAAKDQGFKLVLALLADVFENRHDDHP